MMMMRSLPGYASLTWLSMRMMTKLIHAAEMEEMKLARVLIRLSELPYKMADITIRYRMTENTAARTSANYRKTWVEISNRRNIYSMMIKENTKIYTLMEEHKYKPNILIILMITN